MNTAPRPNTTRPRHNTGRYWLCAPSSLFVANAVQKQLTRFRNCLRVFPVSASPHSNKEFATRSGRAISLVFHYYTMLFCTKKRPPWGRPGRSATPGKTTDNISNRMLTGLSPSSQLPLSTVITDGTDVSTTGAFGSRWGGRCCGHVGRQHRVRCTRLFATCRLDNRRRRRHWRCCYDRCRLTVRLALQPFDGRVRLGQLRAQAVHFSRLLVECCLKMKNFEFQLAVA